eukprot:10398127-Alexandrium_andersonii.AAC.1
MDRAVHRTGGASPSSPSARACCNQRSRARTDRSPRACRRGPTAARGGSQRRRSRGEVSARAQ